MDAGSIFFWMVVTLPSVQAYLSFVEGRGLRVL